ncbi:MAG: hypothetical protein R3B93_26350 [Bacteroidia bacterium]
MKNTILLFCSLLCAQFLLAQPASVLEKDIKNLPYLPTSEHPFGQVNPEAPSEIKDFDPMIGKCYCESITRNQDGNWNEPAEMIWIFKYIMNGMAVQDETFKMDGTYSGSIRQFDPETSRWVVHYYSTGPIPTTLPSWLGGKKGEKIILYREQKAPNGMEGFYRLTFSDMTKEGYKWIGEWVNTDETIVYPTWKIDCKKE